MRNKAVVVFTLIVSDLSICGKQNIVQVVAFYIYMLTINEEISKIETYLLKHPQVCLLPDGLANLQQFLYGTFENTCVNCPGVAPGYANAQPPSCDKITNAPPLGLTL